MIYLDVRTKEEFEEINMPGSIHIPLDILETHAHVLSKEVVITVFCASGARAFVAKQILENLGFTQVIHGGGLYDVMKIDSLLE